MAGGPNAYRYTPNAVSWVDPFGLCPKEGCGPESFTYRGDSRGHEEIFEDGFRARGDSTDLMKHELDNTNPPSAYVSTTKSPEKAYDFATQFYTEPGNIYTVRPRNGIDVNEVLGPRSPFPDELEVAVPNRIAPADVRGVTPIRADGSYVGHSILNPNFKP